jgi:uncharacterized BrkB/YihY/UPF0761 family membrane protein
MARALRQGSRHGGARWGLGARWGVKDIVAICIKSVSAWFGHNVPRESIPWSDVWIGATVTASLFTVGKSLIGIYLGTSSFNSAYGAAGSLIVLLLWIYYSAQIFPLGAEFTRVFAYEHGSRSGRHRPAAHQRLRANRPATPISQ